MSSKSNNKHMILTARGELGSMNESGLPGIPIGDPIPLLFRRCALEVTK